MLIDSHHHFWSYDAREYAWIDEDMGRLRRNFLPDDLEAAAGAAGVTGVVSVQARESLEETGFLLGLGADCERVRGVVGWVPLVNPSVGEMLGPWEGNRLFKGVREVTQGRPDEAFFGNPGFHGGLRELTRRGLTYDVLVYANQLPAATGMVEAHPEQRFILDHIAKPSIRRERFPDEWARDLRALAKHGNVFCKLSGLVTEVRDPSWDAKLLKPYFETVLEAFGPKRLMFGSDWPVCLLRAEYGDWLECAKSLASELSGDEQAAFFGGTAVRAYGL